jgi:xylose isomerase
VLEDARWDGMRHFDSHAYRTEDEDGVWDFAYASMRTYLILKEKAERFNKDPEVQGLLKELKELDRKVVVDTGAKLKYNPKLARQLKDANFDVAALRAQGYRYERLDQLTTEVLLGVR